MSITITLPFPPSGLSPNARLGWRAKAKLTAQYRKDCGWEGKAQAPEPGWPLTPPVRADVTFVVPDKRRRDLDNLLAMLKPAFDGLVDAGVLAGDDSERFRVGAVSIEVGEPKVIVELSGAGTT